MGQFKFTKCSDIEGLYIIEPKIFGDKRGYNTELYNAKDYKEAGLHMEFVQENQSMSRKGVLRGLHYQRKHAQGKLVYVTVGEVFDAVVDIREGSKTYGEWFGAVLSADKNNLLYVPEGFAHGFLVLSDIAVFSYKLTDYYHPEDESGILWNDKTIGIEWPIPKGMDIITSERDNKHPIFQSESYIQR